MGTPENLGPFELPKLQGTEHSGHELEFVPALCPKNRVLWVADDAGIVGLEKGAEAKIPLMVVPKGYPLGPDVVPYGQLAALPRHGRDWNLLKVAGVAQPRFSSKGGGHNEGEIPSLSRTGRSSNDSTRVLGLFTKKEAELDRDNVYKYGPEGFSKPVAIIELLELPYPKDGILTMQSQEQLKDSGAYPDTYVQGGEKITYVSYIRNFISNTRFEDLSEFMDSNKHDDARKEILSTIETLALQPTIGRKLSFKEYALHVANNLAKTIGKIHHNGELHGFPHAGNFTIAGEVIDLASIKKATLTTREEVEKEMRTNAALEDKIIEDGMFIHPQVAELFGTSPNSRPLSYSHFGLLQHIYKMAKTLRTLFPNEEIPSDTEIESSFIASYLESCPENAGVIADPVLYRVIPDYERP